MQVLLKSLVTWFIVWMIVACPAWGSHELTVFGMKMAALSMCGALVIAIVALWKWQP